jgi:hypothetical protein
MKRLLSLLLALILAAALCACGGTAPAEPSPEPAASAEPGQEDPSGQEEQTAPLSPAQEELSALLGEVRENVSIGTAGSSLRAAAMAAKLLDWAETARLSDEQLLAVLEPWLGELTDEIPADFREQLAAVSGAAELLTADDAEAARGLLDDAGLLDSCAYPWSEGAAATLQRIFELAGVTEPDALP